jgi:DNA-binding transcriptional ArsR family regulator
MGVRRDVFQAIADPTRRNILSMLIKEAQNVNSIAEQFNMTRQAVSLHLKIMSECGVISIRKEGRERYCALEPKKLAEVNDWLEPFKKMWESRFDNLDKLLFDMQKTPKTGSRGKK